MSAIRLSDPFPESFIHFHTAEVCLFVNANFRVFVIRVGRIICGDQSCSEAGCFCGSCAVLWDREGCN